PHQTALLVDIVEVYEAHGSRYGALLAGHEMRQRFARLWDGPRALPPQLARGFSEVTRAGQIEVEDEDAAGPQVASQRRQRSLPLGKRCEVGECVQAEQHGVEHLGFRESQV